MIDRDKLVEDLGNVHDFLRAIEDPAADSVAVAAGLIAGELEWHPAARLLTLGEVREWKDFLWVEIREPGAMPKGVFKGIFVKMEEADMIFHIWRPYWIGRYSAVLYGLRFRCWAEKPTEADMEGAAWEAEDDG